MHKINLSCLFIIFCSFGAAQAAAPIAPETIKQQVQTASYSSGYSYVYDQGAQTYSYLLTNSYSEVAQNVLASNSLTALFKNYTLNDILSWTGGNYFLVELVNQSATPKDINILISTITKEQDVIAVLYQCGYLCFEQLIAKGSEAHAQKLAHLLYTTNQNNNIVFQSIIPNLSNSTAKQRLFSYIKVHIQVQLKTISLDTILNETTPTAIHMLSDYDTTITVIQDVTSTYDAYKTQIAQLLCSVIKDEKKLASQGYLVFFHSQRWDYLLVEKLYTDLWALINHKKRPLNYLFPHVRVKGYDPLEKGPLSRTSILKTGRTNFHDRKALLFVNNSLFGKYKNDPYSSSLHFFLTNSNINGSCTKLIAITPEQIFEHYKLKKLFLKYQKELASIENCYNQAHTLGTLLMIAVPKKMVANYCYAAIPGGYKNPSEPDITSFLDELAIANNKLNNEEFCIIMLDEAMNPEGGILIKAYHCAEIAAYKQFETNYEKLIQKLSAEINPPATTTKESPAAPIKKAGKSDKFFFHS